MANMTENERDLLGALAGAIGDFARLQREIRLGASPAVVDEMATVASARARAVLVAWPMSEAPAEAMPRTAADRLPGEGVPDLATLARAAGAP